MVTSLLWPILWHLAMACRSFCTKSNLSKALLAPGYDSQVNLHKTRLQRFISSIHIIDDIMTSHRMQAYISSRTF